MMNKTIASSLVKLLGMERRRINMALSSDEIDSNKRISALFNTPTGEEGLRWLEQGDERQQGLADSLYRSGLLDRLAFYHPSIAGTFPIGIDLPESDMDVLFEVYDHEKFLQICTGEYGRLEGFEAYRRSVEGEERTVVRFLWEQIPVELFGQGRPPALQNGCRHMIVERRLLALDEPSAAEAIRKLKREGLKTEPAFAHFYNLPGNPYEVLYRLVEADEQQLRQIIRQRPSN